MEWRCVRRACSMRRNLCWNSVSKVPRAIVLVLIHIRKFEQRLNIKYMANNIGISNLTTLLWAMVFFYYTF